MCDFIFVLTLFAPKLTFRMLVGIMFKENKSTENFMKNAFYPMVFRQKYIRRWGLMRNMTEETLSEHSYDVAVLTHALCTIGNGIFGKSYDTGKAVCYALFHDVQEVYTGDMPTPAKYYNEEMRANYAKIEENATKQLLTKLPEQLVPAYDDLLHADGSEYKVIVKAADKLSAYIKCIEERKAGNSDFLSAERQTREALEGYHLPEVDYFLLYFIPAFELTLDELGTIES